MLWYKRSVVTTFSKPQTERLIALIPKTQFKEASTNKHPERDIVNRTKPMMPSINLY